MEVRIHTEYITLGQLLKYVNIISAGGDAKIFLETTSCLVNGTLEVRRGRKLYPNDKVEISNKEYLIYADK